MKTMKKTEQVKKTEPVKKQPAILNLDDHVQERDVLATIKLGVKEYPLLSPQSIRLGLGPLLRLNDLGARIAALQKTDLDGDVSDTRVEALEKMMVDVITLLVEGLDRPAVVALEGWQQMKIFNFLAEYVNEAQANESNAKLSKKMALRAATSNSVLS